MFLKHFKKKKKNNHSLTLFYWILPNITNSSGFRKYFCLNFSAGESGAHGDLEIYFASLVSRSFCATSSCVFSDTVNKRGSEGNDAQNASICEHLPEMDLSSQRRD